MKRSVIINQGNEEQNDSGASPIKKKNTKKKQKFAKNKGVSGI